MPCPQAQWRVRELKGTAPASHPGALGYSKDHLGLGSWERAHSHDRHDDRRPGKGPSQAGHIYMTKGQNWRHWCNGLFIRTSLNRFWLSCLLPFQVCSCPLPAQRAQPLLATWPPLIGVFKSLAFQYHPAKATGSSYQR